MDLFFSLFPLFFVLVAALAIGRIVQMHRLPTFQQYKERYPQVVGGRGGVRCRHCNSNQVSPALAGRCQGRLVVVGTAGGLWPQEAHLPPLRPGALPKLVDIQITIRR